MKTSQPASESILIVDDDADTREFLRFLFQAHGFVVHEARDGMDALDVLESSKGGSIPCVVTDQVMPRMNGMQLCRALRESTRHRHVAIIILLTAHPVDASDGAKACFDHVLSKPVDGAVLVSAVQQAFERSRLECT